jgi:prevent-host-death family protein
MVLMSASDPYGESLSQRELRNESGRVLRLVSEGQSFVLTNRGIPVGRIVPLDAPAATLPIVRPAKRVGGWAALRPEQTQGDRSMSRIMDELREDRV